MGANSGHLAQRSETYLGPLLFAHPSSLETSPVAGFVEIQSQNNLKFAIHTCQIKS